MILIDTAHLPALTRHKTHWPLRRVYKDVSMQSLGRSDEAVGSGSIEILKHPEPCQAHPVPTPDKSQFHMEEHDLTVGVFDARALDTGCNIRGFLLMVA